MAKRLTRLAALSLALLWLAGVPAARADETVTLRFHGWAPPHFINTVFLPQWFKEVEEATEGRVKIKLTFPPKVPPPTMFDRVRDGIADLAWGLHAYTPGRFELTESIELPFLDATSEVASVAYWRMHQRHLAAAKEHEGVKLVTLSVTTPGVLHSTFPIESLADLKGKKFRVPGGIAARIAERLGVVGVHAPAPKVYEMLQQGVIEGVFMPPETANSFKFKEVTTHMTLVPKGLYMSSFFIVLNEDAFNRMSKRDQEAFMRVSGEHAARMWGKVWDAQDPPAMESARKAGGTIGTANDRLAGEISDLLQDFDEAWIKKASGRGVDGGMALTFLRNEIAKLKAK